MSADGTWKITMKTPMGPQVGMLELTTSDHTVTGTATMRGDTLAISDGVVEGPELRWAIRLPKPLPMTGHFVATLEGDRLVGTAKVGPMGEVTFEGRRIVAALEP